MGIKHMWHKWKQLSDIGRDLMGNPVVVIGPSFIMSSFVICQLGKAYLSDFGGGWYLLVWFILSLLGTGMVMWVLGPVWGVYYLHRIEADFGPMTRAGVWTWYSNDEKRDADVLNIENLAKECGEYQKS